MARPRRPPLNPRLAEHRAGSGLTQEQVAERLGITPEMVRRHEHGLSHPSEPNRRGYCALYRATESALGLVITTVAATTSDESIERLVSEISASGTSDEAIQLIDHATTTLTELHTRAPARDVLRQVLRLRNNAHALLRGSIRLSQARDVYRIESELLAHACVLFSDVKLYAEARRHGMAGLTFAKEAGSGQAIIRSALAKSLRWEERLIESMDMARVSYECSPMTPIRLQLGSYEANAAALLGDTDRAHAVLRRVEDETPACEQDSGDTVWSFPRARQAIFALPVATQNGDPERALHAASTADESWAAGAPMVKANWAQIRIGAATAHLDRGDLDAAAANVLPVLDMPPELRVATVTAYTSTLARRLAGGAAGPLQGTAMSPLPVRMRNRWANRAEQPAGQGTVYWHVLLGEHAEARAAAADVRRAVGDNPGFHRTPPERLHMTLFVAGSSGDVDRRLLAQAATSVGEASKEIPAVDVFMRRVLYHPEAIMLAVEPAAPLRRLREQVRAATASVLPGLEVLPSADWVPHVTVAYSTSGQPAAPIIDGLGASVPERRFTVDALSLVVQWGPERAWNWETTARVLLID